MDQNQLIKRAKRKNRKAVSELYEYYKNKWYSICLRYQKDSFDAQDVLQNSAVQIFKKIKHFDSKKGDFGAWTYRIVVNENLMALRKHKAYEPIENYKDIELNDETSLEKLEAEELMQLIKSLPTGYRAVFNLYAIESYSHKEIAEMLNITIGTSKSQLSKARALLRKKLEILYAS